MDFKDYVSVFLEGIEMQIPSTRFWHITAIVINMGVNIKLSNGHILTFLDCINEANDLINGIEYDGGWVRAWWEQYQCFRGSVKKPKWIE